MPTPTCGSTVCLNLTQEERIDRERYYVTSRKTLITKRCGFRYVTSRACASFIKCHAITVLQFIRLSELSSEILLWFTQVTKRTLTTGLRHYQGPFRGYITARAPLHLGPFGRQLVTEMSSFARHPWSKAKCSQRICFGTKLAGTWTRWKAGLLELSGASVLMVCLFITLGDTEEAYLQVLKAAC